MKKIMVVGAAGVLGTIVCHELLKVFENQIKLVVTDYKQDRGKQLANSFNKDVEFRCLQANDEEHVRQVIKNVDLVVVVLKQNNPYIQRVCIENRIYCIDLTPFYEFGEKVSALSESAQKNEISSVIMSGFFPGLSGLLIKKAISNFQDVKEINVALLQNTNAKAGVSGIIDMLKIISQPVFYQNKVLEGFSQKRNFYFLHHEKEEKVRLIDHSEKLLVKEKITTAPTNYWTAWNVPVFNSMVSTLIKTGLIKRIQKINNKFLSKVVKHDTTKDEQAFLTVEVKGIKDDKQKVRTISLATFSDYHTTAMVTAALAKITLHKNVKGVLCPFEITTVDELLLEMNCPNIIIKDVEE